MTWWYTCYQPANIFQNCFYGCPLFYCLLHPFKGSDLTTLLPTMRILGGFHQNAAHMCHPWPYAGMPPVVCCHSNLSSCPPCWSRIPAGSFAGLLACTCLHSASAHILSIRYTQHGTARCSSCPMKPAVTAWQRMTESNPEEGPGERTAGGAGDKKTSEMCNKIDVFMIVLERLHTILISGQ